MRIIRENDTIQLELTSFCHNNCANCTRLCGHYRKPWFMDWDTFKRAVDSMVGFDGKQGVGLMGGEPLHHPEFERFARYAAEKLGSERVGLWSCFPAGKEHLGPVIAECCGTVFVNDHSRPDVLHAPFLVSIKEVIEDKADMWYLIEKCWAWACWSASINPLGAYFCEIAASLAALFGDPRDAWPVEPGWWKRVPKDYVRQMERWCPLCGGAVPLKKRYSVEEVDDVSPAMAEKLAAIGSPKMKRGQVAVSDLQLCIDDRPMATYKDEMYRKTIANRYGLILVLNARGFHAPFRRICNQGGQKP